MHESSDPGSETLAVMASYMQVERPAGFWSGGEWAHG